MAMASTAFRPGLYSGGGSRLQTFHPLKSRRWAASFSCDRYPFPSLLSSPTSFSCSSSSPPRRMASAVVKAEASSNGSVTDGPPKGSSLTAKREEEGGGLLQALQRVTPVVVIKWTAMAALALTACRAAYRVFFTPALWTYGSWLLVVWPLPAAVALGIWSIISALPLRFNKRKEDSVKERDQIFILAGALTWLILVPLGLRHGYIEGWPLTLFLVYWYFFLISAVIRLRKYGELSPKSEDKQWSSSPGRLAQIAFGIALVGGHWLAAYEGPHLYFTWNWQWPTRFAVIIIGLAVALHYNASYFLGKYFDRLVKPTQLVVFGPYRIVRHPIYTSYMLLFAGYCVALRAYKTLAFLTLACLLYYEQRVRLEEEQLEEAFGKEQYKVYRKQTKYKFFPFLY
eukprot:c21282_g1_i1 orf=214-1410(-)